MIYPDMDDTISSHYSFIVRCFRDASGVLRGWVVDVLTQRSYPFATREEMADRIESLVEEVHDDHAPQRNDLAGEGG